MLAVMERLWVIAVCLSVCPFKAIFNRKHRISQCTCHQRITLEQLWSSCV